MKLLATYQHGNIKCKHFIFTFNINFSIYSVGNCKLVLTYMNLPHTNSSLQTKGLPTGIVTTFLNEIKVGQETQYQSTHIYKHRLMTYQLSTSATVAQQSHLTKVRKNTTHLHWQEHLNCAYRYSKQPW